MRDKFDRVMDAAVPLIVALALGAVLLSLQQQGIRGSVTIPATDVVELEPAPVVPEPDEDTVSPLSLTPLQPTSAHDHFHPTGNMVAPLTFRGPEGVLVVPFGTNFDAIPEHCARKLLALVARENAPGEYVRYRDARHGAAVRACPEMRR